jgi:hypothetical protein
MPNLVINKSDDASTETATVWVGVRLNKNGLNTYELTIYTVSTKTK